MNTNTLITWSLTMLLAIGIAMPACAQGFSADWHDRGRIRVVQVDAAEHTRIFGLWFSAQVGTYNDIDVESHRRIGDMLQLVDAVGPNRVWVNDKQTMHQPILLAANVEVDFPRTHRVEMVAKGALSDVVTPGDLVILQGRLRDDGKMVVNKIRVMGHAWGWGAEVIPVSAGSGYGCRYWGNVVDLNVAAGWCEVKTNHGRRRVHLTSDGVMLFGGRTVTLDTLRISDRVVFYANMDGQRDINSYRLVILRDGDVYPEADRPCGFDPAYELTGVSASLDVNVQVVGGQVDYLATGPSFHKLVLRTDGGGSRVVYTANTLRAERGGTRIALADLQASDHLSVSFREINGNYFATRIVVR